ncbi:MAG: type VI secretion system tube protein Hcp [Steroidobacteraceae bacterium]
MTKTHRFLKYCIAAINIVVFSPLALADTFLLVPGFTGDSTDPSHKGWLRVTSVEWTVGSNGTFPARNGTEDINVGLGVPIGLTVQLPSGPWSIALMRRIASGNSAGQVTIDHVASDGKPIYRMRLDRVFLKQYQVASTSRTMPVDEIAMVFRAIRYEYFVVGADGRISSTAVEWNIGAGTIN